MKTIIQNMTVPQLNWAVACLRGYSSFTFWPNGQVSTRQSTGLDAPHNYCTDWNKSGIIIDREGITLMHRPEVHLWWATAGDARLPDTRGSLGRSPLIAAMRAYVLLFHDHDDEIEIPPELE